MLRSQQVEWAECRGGCVEYKIWDWVSLPVIPHSLVIYRPYVRHHATDCIAGWFAGHYIRGVWPLLDILMGREARAGRPGQLGIPSSTMASAGVLTASTVSNLLPFAPRRLAAPARGVYIGEGLLPVPAKLAERIVRWEYIEMSEMLPEFWTLTTLDEPDSDQL